VAWVRIELPTHASSICESLQFPLTATSAMLEAAGLKNKADVLPLAKMKK
jgi:hypothetical protein